MQIITRDEKRTILSYATFNVFILITNLIVISLVSFFHFQLNHQLGDVENWLSNNAWLIIILVKVFCFSVFFLFYAIGPDSYTSRMKSILKKSDLFPSLSVVVVCFGIYFLIGSIGSYVGKNDFFTLFDVHKFLSYLGTFVFYLVDFLIIYIITFKRKKRLVEIFALTMLFYFFSRIVIPYKDHVTIMIALHFFTMLIFSHSKNLGDPLFYLTFVVSAFSILWGLDPIWGAEFSFFKLELVDIAFYYIACWCLCLGYYSFKRRQPVII